MLPHRPEGLSDYANMFDSIVEHALHRGLTPAGTVALARAFADSLTRSVEYRLSEPEDETTLVPQPLSYALAVGLSSEAIRATHLAITLLVVREPTSFYGTRSHQWERGIALMLWISIPKELGYLDALSKSDQVRNNDKTWKIWDEIAISSSSAAIKGPYVEEIGRILWQEDNAEISRLSRDAFEDPQSLASDVHLSSIPLTPNRGIWSSCSNGFLPATSTIHAHNLYLSPLPEASELIVRKAHIASSVESRLSLRVSIGPESTVTLSLPCLLCPIPKISHV
jgi:hypothetical protein